LAIGSLVTSEGVPEPRLPGLFSLRLSCRYTSIMLRIRSLPAGFIPPCLPTKADDLPSGGLWLHEIKHDGFRVIARKNGAQVRLYSRPGNDLTDRSR
jgi:ATP-dependent DNA ligase